MEKNQSEQQFYLSNLGSPSIISPAQFPCTVIGSNKNIIHTVPNSNSSLNFNTKYSNASNDFKLAQNLQSPTYNCYSNNSSDELKFMLANNKAKKPYIKRNLNLKSPCLNSNDNSSDITAAPNQLTILVQEVLPAQVPDNPVLTTSSIPPHINSTHLSIKAHSSTISTTQLNEKMELSTKKEPLVEKDKSMFSPASKESESIHPVSTNPSNMISESRDTISEVIKEVLMKALSNDPHEDVFLSVIKSREHVARPFIDNADSLDITSSMSSPNLSQPSESATMHSSIQNNIPFHRHSDQLLMQQCRTAKTISTNFIRPPLFLNQNELIKPIANELIKSPSIIAQSYQKSDFYSAASNCQTQQKPSITNDDALLQPNAADIGLKNNKRRNPSVTKSTNKKQKLCDPAYQDKLIVPMQRYQQNMVKQLGAPNFRKLVHEPRIKNNLTVLAPLGCKLRAVQCCDIEQLQDNCVKYRRVPFAMPHINPLHLMRTDCSSDNGFILQNINASIPEGVLLSTNESDDIDCLIAPSPTNNELDYLSAFNADPISSPSVNLCGPNLEMLHPPHRTQSPQLSVFHCPNKDYLAPSTSNRKPIDCQSVLRATGISRVQISHKYSSLVNTELQPVAEHALIDSETGEIVSKPSVNEQIRSKQSRPGDKLIMTFTINPPDDVEKTVRNITDVLGIDYQSVEFKETTRGGGELAIDKDSMAAHAIPREICERYNTSVIVNSANSCKLDPANLISPIDKINDQCPPPIYSEKVYKSTALLNKQLSIGARCAHCDKLIGSASATVVCDNNRWKCRDLSFCDENCQQDFSLADEDNLAARMVASAPVPTSSSSSDQCIFIGDDRCDASSVIVQGSISKSKQISKRLGALINDKLLKKKAALVPTLKLSPRLQHKGSKYYVYRCVSPSENSPNSSVISDGHFHRLSSKSRTVLRHTDPSISDRRSCALCHRQGDLADNGPGRLLCFDVDRWLHVNCALWCNNVFEMQCGALNNVSDSFDTSLKSVCNSCSLPGAGIGCYYPRCTLKYHVPCAQERGCLFFADRAMYCPLHQTRDLGPPLASLLVDRRVYISRDESSQVAGTVNSEDEQFYLRVGSLIVLSIGQLLPHQIHSGHFHNLNHVYPSGFRSRRIHWSSRVPNARAVYECQIVTDDTNTRPIFKVTAIDSGLDNECHTGTTCAQAWHDILAKIGQLRQANGAVQFFPQHIRPEDLFGLTEPHVLRAIESLPGLDSLSDYAFKFGKMQLIGQMPLPINGTGSMRTEPFVRLHRHTPHKPVIHQSPTSASVRPDSTKSSSSTNLTSKWQQYRKLRTETKLNVVLKRSKIQGFGLYAARDIEKGTMIIEYVGELIRNEVANRREKQYESKQQGIYMFRLDPLTVIDATRAGDLARYINHCCDPNCVTELLEFEKESHIVIISNRKIDKSEELTYDYKFDLDDGKDDKIPCLCGARNCRRWMN